jgi:hypothetical protein
MPLTRRQWLGVLAAIFVLFFAVAIYTPLRRHKAGNPYRCTLNDIDQAVAEAAVVVGLVLVVLVRLGAVAAAWAGRVAVGVIPLPRRPGASFFLGWRSKLARFFALQLATEREVACVLASTGRAGGRDGRGDGCFVGPDDGLGERDGDGPFGRRRGRGPRRAAECVDGL